MLTLWSSKVLLSFQRKSSQLMVEAFVNGSKMCIYIYTPNILPCGMSSHFYYSALQCHPLYGIDILLHLGNPSYFFVLSANFIITLLLFVPESLMKILYKISPKTDP